MGQTLFTSLYIDKLLSNCPTKLADAKFGKQDPEAPTFQQQLLNEVLRPYCLALIKGCFYVNCQIMAEHTYEVNNTSLQVARKKVDQVRKKIL